MRETDDTDTDPRDEDKKNNIDYIAVTNGPGLPPALWVGVTFAKELAVKLGGEKPLPIYPINHMEGHIVSALSKMENNIVQITQPEYPILSLLISGGHTEFVLSKEPQIYQKIGETQDDAVGECFDKVARMLGLPYPGGPEIGKLAQKGREENTKYDFKFPRPMLHTKDFNFSFSGLKTSILYFIRDLTTPSVADATATPSKEGEFSTDRSVKLIPEDPEDMKIKIATEFEYAVRDVLFYKSKKAIEETGAKSFVVGGGVISSPYLREELLKLEEEAGAKVYLSDKQMATDNALMIALTCALQIENKKEPTSDFSAVGSKNYSWS
jgi:N6-L-threonylcarbamoyladenine synthase